MDPFPKNKTQKSDSNPAKTGSKYRRSEKKTFIRDDGGGSRAANGPETRDTCSSLRGPIYLSFENQGPWGTISPEPEGHIPACDAPPAMQQQGLLLQHPMRILAASLAAQASISAPGMHASERVECVRPS